MIEGRHLIGGEWIAAQAALPDISPSDTNDIVGRFPSGDAAAVAAAAAAAADAQHAWARSNIQTRHDLLRRVADALRARREEIARTLAREEGKILAEATGEVMRAAHIFDFFAGECLRLSGEILPSLRDGVGVEITREPLGTVGIIAPWNYPIAIPAWKIAPALAYGNCVVFKPAELVPATAYLLAQAIVEAGFPPGVFNLVFGKGRIVGEAMTGHPAIQGISFTGSVATGRAIAAACVAADPMKKIQLELGGKNPLVVLDDADLEVAAEAAVNGAFYSTGQRCTASSRLIVTAGIHDRFVAAVRERMAGLRIGNALDPASQIGPAVDEGQLEQNLRYVRLGEEGGAKLVSGGARIKASDPGWYMSPALFVEADNAMAIAREEIFGPVGAVIRVKDYEEALGVANDTKFGLSSGICTTSLKHAAHFKRNSGAGMVTVNLPTAGTDYHAPFGGRRNSSFGPREQGRYAAEFYTSVKTAYTAAG